MRDNSFYGTGSSENDEYTFEELRINTSNNADYANRQMTAPSGIDSDTRWEKAVVKFDNVETRRIHGNVCESKQRRVSKIPDNSRILCRINGKNGKIIRITENMLSKHILINGGIGCGKTNTIFQFVSDIKKTMTENDVMVIFDSKGDFYEEFGRDDPKALVIGSKRHYPIYASWNIFSELLDENGELLEDDELKTEAFKMMKALFKGKENETQPFFTIAPQDMMAMVVIAFCREARRTGDYSKLNNRELVRFFDRATAKEYDELFSRPGNEDFNSARNYYGDPSKELTPQALGVLGSIKTVVRTMFIGPFAGAHERSFGMSSIIRGKGGVTVYIEYDLSHGEVLGPMYGLLTDLALKQALGGRKKDRGSVYLIVDEMRLIGELEHLSNALNFGRSQNVKVIAGIQNINQIYDVYGIEKGKSIVSGFMNSICFQSYDSDTRDFLTKRSGEVYDNLSFTVNNVPCNIQREGHVIEDWDILELDVGEAFVNLFGYAPFRFSFAEYE